jgi:dTDP-4-amino-4,6-dideoxygalactose transaminase
MTTTAPTREALALHGGTPVRNTLLPYGRQSIDEDDIQAVVETLRSDWLTTGPRVDEFEEAFAAWAGARYAVSFSSGTAALHGATFAAGVGAGDEAITTPLTFAATANCVLYQGGTPVFADISDRTLNIDPAKVETRLQAGGSYKVRALLPVHLYGQCADIDSLQRLCDEFKLTMIEDAAQAIGASWRDRRAGSLGIAAAFSFYPSKNLSAYGEAGLVTTRDPDLAEHMRRLRNHGSPQRYHHEEFGWNCRMDAIQAAVLRVKLPHIEKWNQQRRERAAAYHRLLDEAGLLNSGDSPIRELNTCPQARPVFHQYVIRAQRRDELRKFLSDRKIGTEIYYPLPLHLQPCFAYLGYLAGDLPESEHAASEVLALPMFPELTAEEQSWVVESIADFYS